MTFINLVMEISSLLPLLPSLIAMFSIYFLAALIPIDYSFIHLLGEVRSLEGKEWRRIPPSWWDRVSELNSDKVLYGWEWAFIMGRIFALFLRAAWGTEVLWVAGELDRRKEMTELPGHWFCLLFTSWGCGLIGAICKCKRKCERALNTVVSCSGTEMFACV